MNVLRGASSEERRVLVETEHGGTIELLAEPDRVVLFIERGDGETYRSQRIALAPSAATNIGRRLQGHANKALDLRDARSNEGYRS